MMMKLDETSKAPCALHTTAHRKIKVEEAEGAMPAFDLAKKVR